MVARESFKCKVTHIRKVRDCETVQVSVEAAAARCAPQKTGYNGAVVLQQPPGGGTEQESPTQRTSTNTNKFANRDTKGRQPKMIHNPQMMHNIIH